MSDTVGYRRYHSFKLIREPAQPSLMPTAPGSYLIYISKYPVLCQ